jgi:four helix bundle protein
MNPTQKGETPMSFHALDVAIEMTRSLRQPVAKVARCDASLASQIRRAASSVPLNVAEARKREGRDRVHLFRVAAGSAAEVRSALETARAWGYLDAESSGEPLALLDRELAMLWRLTHRR